MNYYKPEIECAPRSELEALQSYRLSRTVRRVYENVAPYRKKMDEAGSLLKAIRKWNILVESDVWCIGLVIYRHLIKKQPEHFPADFSWTQTRLQTAAN